VGLYFRQRKSWAFGPEPRIGFAREDKGEGWRFHGEQLLNESHVFRQSVASGESELSEVEGDLRFNTLIRRLRDITDGGYFPVPPKLCRELPQP
jgi:hypothetical protein